MIFPRTCVGGKTKARKRETVFPAIFQSKHFSKFYAFRTTPTKIMEEEQKSARILVYLSELNSAKDLAEESLKSSIYFAFAEPDIFFLRLNQMIHGSPGERNLRATL